MTQTAAGSRYLLPERQRKLRELAEFIADEYSPGDGPVDPELILRDEGLTLSYGNYENAFDGLLEHKRGRFHVYCNVARCRTPTRKRFTLGHELGHYYIDEHREVLRAGKVPWHPSFPLGSKNPVEIEADAFASFLMAPETRLRKALGKRAHNMESTLYLAGKLQVSPIVIAGRLLEFGKELLAITYWGPEGFRWKRLSDDARHSQMRKTIEAVDMLPADSPTAVALRGNGGGPPYHSAGTTALSWFPYSRCSDILIEEAVALGEFGVLTILRRCGA